MKRLKKLILSLDIKDEELRPTVGQFCIVPTNIVKHLQYNIIK